MSIAVMALFGLGNILLKIRRKRLPRPERSSWISILIAISAVLLALIGNIQMNPDYTFVFLEYFLPTILLIGVMLNRTLLLKTLLRIIRYLLTPIQSGLQKSMHAIIGAIDRINSQKFVYFSKNDSIETLNKVMLYIERNEHTRNLKIVRFISEEGEKSPKSFLADIDAVDREYPGIKIEFIELKGVFGPKEIQKLSKKWNIPVNFMFLGSPGDQFPYRIEELGGVRLII